MGLVRPRLQPQPGVRVAPHRRGRDRRHAAARGGGVAPHRPPTRLGRTMARGGWRAFLVRIRAWLTGLAGSHDPVVSPTEDVLTDRPRRRGTQGGGVRGVWPAVRGRSSCARCDPAPEDEAWERKRISECSHMNAVLTQTGIFEQAN
jgi:hypothetical protein